MPLVALIDTLAEFRCGIEVEVTVTAMVDVDPILGDEGAVKIGNAVLFGMEWADDNADEMGVVIVGGLVCLAVWLSVFLQAGYVV